MAHRGLNEPEIDDDFEGELDEDDDDEQEDPLAHLPEYVLARVERLQDLNAAREAIMVDYMTERAALEKKFEGLVQPLYAERAAIVCGQKDDEILQNGISSDHAPEEAANLAGALTNGEEERVKGVPQFWACAMTHMDTIGELITVEDVDCLEHLTDVTCVDRDDGKGFTLSFHFAPNDYFTNSVLTKTYEVPNLLISDDPMIKSVKGETIDWKPGKSLTHKTVKKKQRGKGKHAGQVRTVAKEEEKESFFHWFNPPEMPATADAMDEEEAERLEEIFDGDYDVAQAFRCHVIPKAVLWFTGQAAEDEVDNEVAAAIAELAEQQN